jgi:MGT family glycosyltransferase
MAEWQMRIIERTLAGLIADARLDKPACVLVDYLCLWGRFLAQHLDIPAVVLHSTFPFTWSRVNLIYRSIRDVLRNRGVGRKLLSFLKLDLRNSRLWGVPRIGLPYNLALADYGDLHLVLTSKELSHDVHKLDERYCFVGPCIRPAGLTPGEKLPPLDSRPLLYVSLGTFWRHPQRIYSACIEAFAHSGIQVLITGSERIAPQFANSLPENIHIRAHVDQIEVLKRCAAFITHGGMNSVCEALCAGVPTLVYPQAVDQFSQAQFIETSGTGFALKEEQLTANGLRQLVARLVQDRGIHARCQELSRRLRAEGGAARAADLVSSLCRYAPELRARTDRFPLTALPLR